MLGRPNQEIKQAVASFADLIAHKLNNMLTGAMGYAEMAMREGLDEAQRLEYLKEVNAAQEKMRELGKLMNMLGGTGTAPALQPLNPNRLFAVNAKRWHEDNEIEVGLNLDPATAPIMADSKQIDEVLDQLVHNAVIHNGDADPKISFATREESLDEINAKALDLHPGDYVVMSVEDHGRGMTNDVLVRAFEAGFTTAPNHAEHMGVGLTIVDAIMTAHGGRIALKSFPGKGVIANLWFPRAADRLGELEATRKAILKSKDAQTPPSTPSVPRPKVVMVLETDDASRGVIGQVIEDLHYQCFLVQTPEEAMLVASAWRGPLDLFICDTQLKGMTPNVLARRVSDKNPGVKILFSATLQKSDVEDDPATIAKPFTADEVRDKIKKQLG